MQRDPPSGAAAANLLRAGYRVVRDEVTQTKENEATVPTTQFPVMIKVGDTSYLTVTAPLGGYRATHPA